MFRKPVQVTAELAFPLPEHVSAPVVAAVMSVLVGLCPIISIMSTHPFVAEYESEMSSPTGFILSYGSIFWLLLISSGFAGVLFTFTDDERRVVIDSHPKLVAHITDRVAADLAQVCARAHVGCRRSFCRTRPCCLLLARSFMLARFLLAACSLLARSLMLACSCAITASAPTAFGVVGDDTAPIPFVPYPRDVRVAVNC